MVQDPYFYPHSTKEKEQTVAYSHIASQCSTLGAPTQSPISGTWAPPAGPTLFTFTCCNVTPPFIV